MPFAELVHSRAISSHQIVYFLLPSCLEMILMQILHKGKVLYPNTKQSPHEISSQLLDICAKGGKPLVMGTRMTELEQKRIELKWMFQLWLKVVRLCLAKTVALLQGIVSPLLSLGAPVTHAAGHPHRD
jgi:hypothetical protein